VAEVGSAFVSLLPSARGFGSKTERAITPGITSAAKRSGSRFGSLFSRSAISPMAKIGLTVAGLFAIREVKQFFEGAIGEAREAQKVSAITAQVIKTTGGAANISAGQVAKLSTSISNMTGIDDEAIQKTSNLLLTFRNIHNEVGRGNDIFNQATQAVTDMSVALGKDATGAAIQVGKALNDPIKGITALGRAGVQFTEDQKATITSLVETGNTLGAQKIILRELNKEFGGAAAASATAGEKMKTAFNNLQEAVGTKLLPYIDRAELALAGLFATMTTRTGPAFGDFKNKIMPVLTALQSMGETVRAFVTDHLQPFLTLLSGLGGAAVSSFAFLIGNTLVSAIVALVGALLSPVALIGAVVGAAIYAYFHFEKFRATVDSLAVTFQTKVIPALQEFGLWVTGTAVPAVTALAKQVSVNLKPAFDQMATSFRSQVLPALRQFGVMLRENGPEIKTIVTGLLQLTAAWIKVGSAVLGTVLPPLIKLQAFLAGKEIPVLGQLISIILKTGAAWITLGRDVANLVDTSVTAINRMVKAFQTGFAKILGIVQAFPGKVVATLNSLASTLYAMGVHAASELAAGIVAGFKQKLGEIAAAAASIAGAIKSHFPGSPVAKGPLVSWNNGGAGKRLIQMLADGIIAGTPGVVAAALGAATKVQAAVLDRLTTMRDGVKSVIDGLKSDFASLKDTVASAFTGDLFSFDTAAAFGQNLFDTIGNIKDVAKAFKKLLGWGLSPSFLSALFSSGNSALILDLAAGTKNQAVWDANAFGMVNNLSSQLGGQVALADIGPELRSQTRELREIKQAIRSLPKQFGQEINHAASNSHRRAS
jgi:hypothetical protein